MGVPFPQTQIPKQTTRGWESRSGGGEGDQPAIIMQQTPQTGSSSSTTNIIIPQTTRARLAVWLLMIRSRLRRLGGLVVWDRYHGRLGFTIRRPHSPIDRVIRAWMVGVVAEEGGDGDQETMVLLYPLIDLLLHEAREERDYRTFFPFVAQRINVHVARLMQEMDPVLVGEMVFADDVALEGVGVRVRAV
jgi:hypothetical protein